MREAFNPLAEKAGYQHYYDSPAEFLEYLRANPVIPGIVGNQLSSQSRGTDGGWRGRYSTFQEAERAATNGSLDIAAKIMPRDISLEQSTALNTQVYDYAGDNVDVGRYLSGEPECMSSLRRKGKPIVRLLVNIAASANVDARVLEERGRALLDIVTGLEANGYSTDIVIFNRVSRGAGGDKGQGYPIYWAVKIKDSKEYFNILTMSYWLVCPSVLRRMYFAQAERWPTEVQDVAGWGYGRPADIEQADLEKLSNTIHFPRVEHGGGDWKKYTEEVLKRYAL